MVKHKDSDGEYENDDFRKTTAPAPILTQGAKFNSWQMQMSVPLL